MTRLLLRSALALLVLVPAFARADFEAALKCPNSRCALIEFEKGAAAGDPRCKLGWGILLEAGNKPVEALKLYEEAADRAIEEAAFNAGVIYATGNGVPQSYVDADKWFRRFIAIGKRRLIEGRAPVVSPDAMAHLGSWFQAYFTPFSPELLSFPNELMEDGQSRSYLLTSNALLRRLLLFSKAPPIEGKMKKATITLFFRPSDLTVRVQSNKEIEKFEDEVLSKAKRAYGVAPLPYKLRTFSEDLATAVQFEVPN